MRSQLLTYLPHLLGALALIAGSWIGKRATQPKTHERAIALSAIAADVAAQVLVNNPGKPWATLVKIGVDAMTSGIATPTDNREAIQRAIMGALMTRGVQPTAK